MVNASSTRAPLVLYHADCDDGFGAAYAAWRVLGDAATYQPIHHDDTVSAELLTGRHVYILDFSFRPEIIDEMAAVAIHITLLDHHKSAAEQWQGLSPATNVTIRFDMTRSGAQMSWDHFHPDSSRPRLIEHVADRDLWRFALPDTKAFCAGLSLHPKTFDDWQSLDVDAVIAQGRIIAAYQQNQIRWAAQGDLRQVTLLGHTGLAANVLSNTSEVGHEIALRSGTFALLFSIKGEQVMCSLRSVPPFDVSVIAQHYGGGGHAQAAGFRMPIERFFGEIWR